MSQSSASTVTLREHADVFTYEWAKADHGHHWDRAGHHWDTYEWAKADHGSHWDRAGSHWDTYQAA